MELTKLSKEELVQALIQTSAQTAVADLQDVMEYGTRRDALKNELLRRLSGSGAAVSASPQPPCSHDIDKEIAKVAKEDGWELPDANLIEFGTKVWQTARESAESVIAMAVARLGGLVEGRPTARANFLQRIDELRKLESQFFAAAPAQETRNVLATSKADQEPFVPRCIICGEVEANYRHDQGIGQHNYHKFKPAAQEQPIENSPQDSLKDFSVTKALEGFSKEPPQPTVYSPATTQGTPEGKESK